MKPYLHRLFLDNWPRKLISVGLAIIIWFVVDTSLTSNKTISNISIRVINIPTEKTVEGLQPSGLLSKRLTLTFSGKKNALENLNSSDIEVVIDAGGHGDELVEAITKDNIVSLNPELNIHRSISKVSPKNFIVKLTKVATEKIPIYVTAPIGEAPKGYQFLDVWPYQLFLTVRGPEDVVKKLKSRGLKLTFNLSDITKSQLENLQPSSLEAHNDVVSFYVPNQWKQIYIPSLSDTPIVIDDPDAKHLRIDFVRSQLLPITSPIPINLFFPIQHANIINPSKAYIINNGFVTQRGGLKVLSSNFYAKGVSELFLQVVKDMMGIVVFMQPKPDKTPFDWSIQFVNAKALEDRYINSLMSDTSDMELKDVQPQIRQEYLRNRFRTYMNHFQIFNENNQPLQLSIQVKENNGIEVKNNG